MPRTWRDRRFERLVRGAIRVYKGDLGKENAATIFIRDQRRRIEAEEFPYTDDPFMRLEIGLRAHYPELWVDCGKEIVAELRRGDPGETD